MSVWFEIRNSNSVSYTHLDVYKRQVLNNYIYCSNYCSSAAYIWWCRLSGNSAYLVTKEPLKYAKWLLKNTFCDEYANYSKDIRWLDVDLPFVVSQNSSRLCARISNSCSSIPLRCCLHSFSFCWNLNQ